MALKEKVAAVLLSMTCVAGTCIADEDINQKLSRIVNGYHVTISPGKTASSSGTIVAEATDNKKNPYKIMALLKDKEYEIFFFQNSEKLPACSISTSALYHFIQRQCTQAQIEYAASMLESLLNKIPSYSGRLHMQK